MKSIILCNYDTSCVEAIIPFFALTHQAHVESIHNCNRERERSKGVGCEKRRERRKGKSAKSKNTTEEHCADAIDHQIRSECQNGLLNIYRREMDEWRGKNDVFLRWND